VIGVGVMGAMCVMLQMHMRDMCARQEEEGTAFMLPRTCGSPG
jgi:hypothetical protein